MKLIAINKPSIELSGQTFYTQTKMFKNFEAFDFYLKDMEEKHNVHTCYFYTAYNAYDNDLIINTHDGKPILFIRFRLIKD